MILIVKVTSEARRNECIKLGLDPDKLAVVQDVRSDNSWMTIDGKFQLFKIECEEINWCRDTFENKFKGIVELEFDQLKKTIFTVDRHIMVHCVEEVVTGEKLLEHFTPLMIVKFLEDGFISIKK